MYRQYDREEAGPRKKKILLAGGVAVGLAMAFYFSISNDNTPPKPTAPRVKQTARPPEPSAPPSAPLATPAPEKTPPAQPDQTNKASLSPSQPASPAETAQPAETVSQEEAVARLTELNKENLIQEDINASKMESARVIPGKKKSSSGSGKLKNQSPPAEPRKATAQAPRRETGGSGVYTVQMIATTDALKALETRDRLAAAGHKPWIANGSSNVDTYRVEVGIYGSIREAAPHSAKMAAEGFANRPAYLAGGARVTLALGVFAEEAEAQKLTSRAKAAGLDARMRRQADAKSLYMVRVGKFKTKNEAHDAMVDIRKSGFNPMGITD
jgi:cell division protein FtsN